jgi:hypothetical protein
MRKIEIVNGTYRNAPVNGIFELVREPIPTVKGFEVTVDGTGAAGYPQKQFRVVVHDLDQIQDIDHSEDKTDDEIIQEIGKRFANMEKMAEATAVGTLRSLIVSGPAGLGKSYGIMRVLERVAAQHDTAFQVVKGNISAIGMYKLFWEMSGKNSVVVFDDCDAVFDDETKLNLLKGALDSTENRVISWRTDAWSLKDEGIPNEFEFEGTVIFISNLDMEKVIAKDGRMAPHFSALQSRSFYVDCGIHSQREKILRLVQVVKKGGMLKGTVKPWQEEEILQYVWERKDRLREISLRLVTKLAQLVNMGADWKEMADLTCCKSA